MTAQRVLVLALLGAAATVACGAAEPATTDEAPAPVAIPAEMAALQGQDADAALQAIRSIVEAGDTRYVAVFIELLRASQVGLAAPGVGVEAAHALEALTGQDFGTDWSAWVPWYAGTQLEPPPGFLGFKGRLLGGIDPAFRDVLRDGLPSRIRPEEIVWGGVAYEGIPALDRAPVIPAEKAHYLDDDDAVFGITLGGEARAYPLRILDWHEMANDVLGGVPFSLAYCTLCGSGIAYATDVPGVDTFDFGSSGFLMRSNKLMVDRQTRTLWNQFTGRPVLGPLADRDLELAVLPSVVTTWGEWRARHPETTVLSPDTGHRRPYHPGAAYAGYFAAPDTMFPVRRDRAELPEKARIFGIERDGLAVAYPVGTLVTERVVNHRVADLPVVLVADAAPVMVDGDSVRSGPARYDAGTAVRAYERAGHTFRHGAGGALLDESGRSWQVEEDALVSETGERLQRTPGRLAYWFGWHSFHPRTELFQKETAG